MDHSYIREHNIADLYLAGDLPLEEKASFEEHYFDCNECLRELELARNFRSGMKDAAQTPRAHSPWKMPLAFAAGLAVGVLSLLSLPKSPEKTAPLQQEIAPQTNVDVYALNVTRGPSQAVQISLGPSPRLILFIPDQQATPEFRTYKAYLRDGSGNPIWSQEDLRPGARSTFAIAFPSNLLHPGDYSLELRGDDTALATYRINVVKNSDAPASR